MFFLAATAALALSSCTSDDLVQAPEVNGAEDGAVSFSAYVGRENRATINNLDAIKASGFGVYAYEQGTTAWSTYRASNTVPNFFYNQQVTYGTLEHYVLKASVSNEDYAALSTAFQAYFEDTADSHTKKGGAPTTISITDYNTAIEADADDAAACTAVYTSGATAEWEYKPVKYYSNNAGAKHSFFAYAPYNASAKVVFSADGPSIRYTSTEDYDLLWALPTIDKQKADIDERITFNFKHALSKVSFTASTFVDDVHPAHSESAVAENTEVVLRSVKFVGNVPSKGRVSLTTGDWTIEASEESAYEFCPAAGITFDNTEDGDLDVSSNNMVIPTDAATKVQVQVVYDVITTDATNPKNSSTITNTVTSVEEYSLVAGVAYKFNLDLGLTSVKFKATVADWNADEATDVDLPNNHMYHALSSVSISDAPTEMSALYTTTTEPSNHAVSDYWYSPATKVLKVGNGTAYTDAAAKAYYKDAELYVVSTAGSACSLSTPDAVSYGSPVKYYLLSAPTDELTATTVYSLNVNSKGQIQIGADASLAASWVAPTNNAYYTFGGNLYQWK